MGTIQTCDACELHEHCVGPVPFRGPSPNRLMILGEAPGRDEDRAGKPFVGPSGKYLARALVERGLPVLKDWFVANTVCCFPHGTPDTEAREACAVNLRLQVRLCDPDWVLVLGAVALGAVVKGAKVTALRGRVLEVPGGPFIGRYVMPTFHPAAVLRAPHQYEREFLSDLSTFRQLIDGSIDRRQLAVRFGRGGKVVV